MQRGIAGMLFMLAADRSYTVYATYQKVAWLIEETRIINAIVHNK